jgi:predicted NBD/HSP70 family sugar kinase
MNLLFDIGGTNLRIASADKNKIKEVLIFKASNDYKRNLEIFRAAIKELYLKKIGLAVGAIPRFNRGQLTLWETHAFSKDLSRITKSKAIMENDAVLAGLAETNMTEGLRKKIVGYLTISTGFGGARFIKGQLDQNALGFEPRLELNKTHGKLASVDEQISGRGIKLHFHRKPENIKSKKTWKRIEQEICLAVNNAAVLWSPEVMILSGPIVLNKNISIPNIQKFIDKNFAGMPKIPKIKKAQLGQLAGLYGALILAKRFQK